METVMNWKKIVLILSALVFLAGLLPCVQFGRKMVRRTRLRNTAMTAYEQKDYYLAERLLLQYIQKYEDAEEELVALANIYHEFGNAEMEAQMWSKASSLDPQNQEYRTNMLTNAVKSASYALLHGNLGRKAQVDEPLIDQELYLYVISSYRSGYPRDGENAYKKYLKASPEAFHKNDLGRMAEFLATYDSLSDGERDSYLSQALHSEDPVIRFEALFTAIRLLEQRDGDDPENDMDMEQLLKEAMEANYFAGTPILADFYFSRCRFADVIELLKPYLKSIDDINLYLLYAESCVFIGKADEIKALREKLREKPAYLQPMGYYCEILTAYLENDEKGLADAVRKYGKNIDSPLSRFIRLRVALANKSFNEIRTVAQDLFFNPPYHDLHNRALFVCLDYISKEMEKPENRRDLSRMVDLARILSVYLHDNRLLTEIILTDQYQKQLAREEDLMAAWEQFPDDPILQRIAAEYLILNGKPKQALGILERTPASAGDEKKAAGRQILQMLALEKSGRTDEAADVFRKLMEQFRFDPELLAWYLHFCLDHDRTADLISMADRLDAVGDGKLERYGIFFRAAALLAGGDESGKKDALDLLASSPTDVPEFTFYAANRLCENGRFDDAEAKYKAILETYRYPSLPYVNLSKVYKAEGDGEKALEAAKKAFELDKESMLPALVYAELLSGAERYEDAVNVLNFPRHAVNYREDIIALWCECMYHVIEKSIADRKVLLAEEQCRHLLLVAPDDEFGKETMEKIREILFPKKDKDKGQQSGDADDYAAPAA